MPVFQWISYIKQMLIRVRPEQNSNECTFCAQPISNVNPNIPATPTEVDVADWHQQLLQTLKSSTGSYCTVCPPKESSHLMDDDSVATQCFVKITS